MKVGQHSPALDIFDLNVAFGPKGDIHRLKDGGVAHLAANLLKQVVDGTEVIQRNAGLKGLPIRPLSAHIEVGFRTIVGLANQIANRVGSLDRHFGVHAVGVGFA